MERQENSEPLRVSVVLIELVRGKVSVGLRIGESNVVQLLEGWENLEPARAAQIVADIVQQKISAEEVADKPYREITMPDGYFKGRRLTADPIKDDKNEGGTTMQLLQLSYALLVAAALLTLLILIILDRHNRQRLAYAAGDVVRCTRNGRRLTGVITELLDPGKAGQPCFAVIAVKEASSEPRMVMIRYCEISALLRTGRTA